MALDRERIKSGLRARLPREELAFIENVQLICEGHPPILPKHEMGQTNDQIPIAQPTPRRSAFDELPGIYKFMLEKLDTGAKASNTLRAFFERYKSPLDQNAHFLCFRGQKSDAQGLVVSFLALVSPERSGLISGYTFKHFYLLPPKRHEARVTVGIVLPFEGGVYLVGGQQSAAARKSESRKFETLKVIAISWRSIEEQNFVIPGLFMSSNNEGQHLVGRVALRPTCISRYQETGVGAIKTSMLGPFLDQLQLAEDQTGLPDGFKNRPETILQHIRIMELTNNFPTKWNLKGTYTSSEGKNQELRPSFIFDKMTETFDKEYGEKFFNEQGEAFSIWNAIRFGAISTER